MCTDAYQFRPDASILERVQGISNEIDEHLLHERCICPESGKIIAVHLVYGNCTYLQFLFEQASFCLFMSSGSLSSRTARNLELRPSSVYREL
jgi:hypothetical protein